MRKLQSQVWVGAVLLGLILPLSAWADEGNQCNEDSPVNFNSVAILRWYAANQTAQIPVGTTPTALAFDSANMWVANFNNNSVTKLRASDGAKLGTFIPGIATAGIAFDGTNIWVSNPFGGSVPSCEPATEQPLARSPWGLFLGAWPLTGPTSGSQIPTATT